MKSTPSYATFPRSNRSRKPRSIYESGLSLKSIIGTTVSSPTGLDSLPSSRMYAYTAGASAVVVSVSDDGQYSQRFYRARPTAVSTNSNMWTSSSASSTPFNDSRPRSLRESSSGYSSGLPVNTHSDSVDSTGPKSWISRERIKAATCLSISRDAKFLAVGETGYSPRVLIFCLQNTSSESPLTILTEHTHGVTAAVFSPDSRFLATLGSMNDNFLHIWAINPRTGGAKLHSSNKCTSMIKGMVWMGSNVITVGTRHVKVWRIEDGQGTSPTRQKFALDGTPQPAPVQPILKTLQGRNCLLGPMLLDAVFTCVATISENKAILCTDKGDICFLDGNDKQRLSKISQLGFGATCIAMDMSVSRIRIGGRCGRIKTLNLNEILDRSVTPSPTPPPGSPPPSRGSTGGSTSSSGLTLVSNHVCAMAVIGNGDIVSIDSNHSIDISAPSDDDTVLLPKASPFTAHRDNVLGVRLLCQPNKKGAVFFTWSSCGTVLFWDHEGYCKGLMQIEMEQNDDSAENQCSVVRASKDAEFFVGGDKNGMLKIMDGSYQSLIFCTKAHGSAIQDIDIFEGEGYTLIASASRDRTVQLFKKIEAAWVLVQTLDEHTACVSCVSFCENGEKLISAATDRTIQIRQLATKEVGGQVLTAAIPVRIIALKASPVSMTIFSNGQSTALTVSLLDRSITTYDVCSGRLTNSFKAIDNETGEAVVMDSLVMGRPSTVQSRPTLLAGVSSTDKSVRVYEGTTGSFLDRGWGHTASITDVAVLEDGDKTTLISTGSDGTIMIWGLSARSLELQDPFESPMSTDGYSPSKEAVNLRQPIRRILSKAELAEFKTELSDYQRLSPSAGSKSPSLTKVLRKKPSKYDLSNQAAKQAYLSPPPVTFNNTSYSDSESKSKPFLRGRSRSPSQRSKSRDNIRPSLADSRHRNKSTSHLNEAASLNSSTEQICRSLRGFRKKLKGSDMVRDDVMKELDSELRLTAKALGERVLKSKALSESALTEILDQYSERLVTMFHEKLRTSLGASGGAKRSLSEEPKDEGEGSDEQTPRPPPRGEAQLPLD